MAVPQLTLKVQLTSIGGLQPLAQFHRPDLKTEPGGFFKGVIDLNEMVIPITQEEAQQMAQHLFGTWEVILIPVATQSAPVFEEVPARVVPQFSFDPIGMVVPINSVRMGEPGLNGDDGNPDVLFVDEGPLLDEDGRSCLFHGDRFVVERVAERNQVKIHLLDQNGCSFNRLFLRGDQTAVLEGAWRNLYAEEDIIRAALGLEPFESFAAKRIQDRADSKDARPSGLTAEDLARDTGRTTQMIVKALTAAKSQQVYIRARSRADTQDMVADARKMAEKVGIDPSNILASLRPGSHGEHLLFVDHAVRED